MSSEDGTQQKEQSKENQEYITWFQLGFFLDDFELRQSVEGLETEWFNEFLELLHLMIINYKLRLRVIYSTTHNNTHFLNILYLNKLHYFYFSLTF